MKKLIIIFACLLSVLIFSSCESKSGHRPEEIKKQNLNQKQNFVVSGLFFLDGKIGGKRSSRIEYVITQNSDSSVVLNLIKGISTVGATDDSGIPFDIVWKLSNILQEITQRGKFSLEKERNGSVVYGTFCIVKDNGHADMDILNLSVKLLSVIESETGWKITKEHWKTSK